MQQAEAQDKRKSSKPATRNSLEPSEKREIASSAQARKPLVSKWADAARDSKEDEKIVPPKSPRGDERNRRNSRHRRNSETRRKDDVNGQSLRSRDKRRGRNDRQHEPREKQERHNAPEESTEHPVTNETLPPMSKAAASFALRLGIPAGPGGAPNRATKSTPPAHDSDEFVTTDEEDDNVDESPKQPMSKAGMSFAARLAIPPKTNNSPNSTNNSNGSSKANKDQPKPSTQKYMSPKQRREAEKLEQEQQRRKEQQQRDAKLQEEVRDMFSKMTASTANWADLEDE